MIQNNYFYISQSEFWQFFLQQRDASKILSYKTILEEQIELFNKYVAVINIETSAWCNRACQYCPVGLIKPKRKQAFLSDSNFAKILEELEAIDYRGIIRLSLYNEPLADANHLIDKIIRIKKCLPYIYISISTNGDYLTKDLLNELSVAGLKEIFITSHTEWGEEYNDTKRMESIQKILKKLDIAAEPKCIIPNENITYDFIHQNMRILILANNWNLYGNDRGGTVPHLSIKGRRQPCMMPFREMIINHQGYIQPCCNIFSMESIYGNIEKAKLQEIYFSEKMIRFRRNIFLFSPKSEPCTTCNLLELADEEDNVFRKKVLEMAQ
jgi:radical SAM protein with 4Fe4S-binding SPASM domain